jgi:hypothetical protein
VDSFIRSLPTFTISKIGIINCQTRELHQINNLRPSIAIPQEPTHSSDTSPTIPLAFLGFIMAGVVKMGVKLPETHTDYVAIKCSGIFNNLQKEQKTNVGWITDVYVDQSTFINARILEFNADTYKGAIMVHDIQAKHHLRVGSTYPLLNGYWGEMARIMMDSTRKWQKVAFQPEVEIPPDHDDNIEEFNEKWENEHCDVCWRRIKIDDGAAQYGYKDQNENWLCQSCYERYVVSKSLAFPNPNQIR